MGNRFRHREIPFFNPRTYKQRTHGSDRELKMVFQVPRHFLTCDLFKIHLVALRRVYSESQQSTE